MKQLAIIIPAYKATFLEAALASIAAQTCQNFTLYIGDDCSPYDIKGIVDRYRDKIDLVYRRFDENLGGKDLVAQWERCIDMSQGEPWLWLFSDDDVMEPRCVEEFYKTKEEIRQNYLIHFDINVIDSTNNVIRKANRYPQSMSGMDFMRNKMKGIVNSFVVEYIIPRKVFMKNGRFPNFDLAWGSDILAWFKLGCGCKGIYTVDGKDCCVHWRSSGENISPNLSYPIVIRKMYAIVENAKFVQDEIARIEGKRDFSLHARQVCREIAKNVSHLKYGDIFRIYKAFLNRVGFPLQTAFYYSAATLLKVFGYQRKKQK